jgi:hypothetical protein
MIQLKKVNKIYDGLAGKVHALKNVDLIINKGDNVVIIKIWKRRPLIFGLRKYLFRRWNIYLSDWPSGHDNPVKAGLCSNGEDYKYSSARFYKTGVDDFGFLTHWMK